MIQNEKNAPAASAAKIQRTVSGIFWGKFLDVLERNSFTAIFYTACKIILAIFLTISSFYAQEALEFAHHALIWGNWAIPKTLTAFALVFGWKAWVWIAKYAWEEICEAVSRAIDSAKPEMPTWYGIPVPELVDYLFENRTFKRDEVEQRFALPRNRFEEMAKQMDSVNLLKRGENNARILNADFARADVSTMLLEASEDGQLRQLFRKEGEGSYTSHPSMQEILERSPIETGFTIRKIQTDSAA